jgi:hypothetical protein
VQRLGGARDAAGECHRHSVSRPRCGRTRDGGPEALARGACPRFAAGQFAVLINAAGTIRLPDREIPRHLATFGSNQYISLR